MESFLWRCRVSIPVPIDCEPITLPIELHPLNCCFAFTLSIYYINPTQITNLGLWISCIDSKCNLFFYLSYHYFHQFIDNPLLIRFLPLLQFVYPISTISISSCLLIYHYQHMIIIKLSIKRITNPIYAIIYQYLLPCFILISLILTTYNVLF